MSMANDYVPEPPVDRVRQSDAREADINFIVDRFVKTGQLTYVGDHYSEGQFIDVSEVGDYREALERVQQADEYFMQMAPAVRSRFRNDPAEFLDFISDEKNRDEAVKLGLIPAPKEPVAAPGTGAPPVA